MQKVTYNDVRYAVHEALDAAFPKIPIAGEEIKQGLKPPCFFVRFLEPEHSKEVGRRYKRYHPVVIRYFDENKKNVAMYEMAEKLSSALEWIEVKGMKTRGIGMRFEIVDEVLHFFVEYNFHVLKPKDPAEKMGRLEQEGRLK